MNNMAFIKDYTYWLKNCKERLEERLAQCIEYKRKLDPYLIPYKETSHSSRWIKQLSIDDKSIKLL